jgi:hypothetical protein
MTLRDQLEPARTSVRCSVGEWVKAQPDVTEWIELLDDASVQSTRLFKLMKIHGFPHGDSPVQRHRRGGCVCGTT